MSIGDSGWVGGCVRNAFLDEYALVFEIESVPHWEDFGVFGMNVETMW